MINQYHIIDDFYSNPDEVVKFALESIKERELKGNFAGVMTPTSFLAESLRGYFQKLLQEPSIDASTNACGRIRFSKESDSCKLNIHFDTDVNTKWAGVVYLSKDHPNIDGTSFWKHLRTGLEEIPKTAEGFSRYGWNTVEDVANFLTTEGKDESLWEKTFSVPYKYNRLVLFRPWLFHSPGKSFGNSLESSRMVQTLFFGN